MTLVDVLVAAALTASLGASVVMLMSPADAVVRAEQDAIDGQQRLRVIVDALTADIVAAADVAVVADAVTLVARDAAGREVSRRTYQFKRDTHQVLLAEGSSTMPLLDRVADLTIQMMDASSRRVRVTAAIESPATSGLPVPPRTMTFEAAPRRAR